VPVDGPLRIRAALVGSAPRRHAVVAVDALRGRGGAAGTGAVLPGTSFRVPATSRLARPRTQGRDLLQLQGRVPVAPRVDVRRVHLLHVRKASKACLLARAGQLRASLTSRPRAPPAATDHRQVRATSLVDATPAGTPSNSIRRSLTRFSPYAAGLFPQANHAVPIGGQRMMVVVGPVGNPGVAGDHA